MASAGISALLSRANQRTCAAVGSACVRKSQKEEVCDLKPIIVTQRGSTPSQQRRSPPAGSESCMGDILLSVDSGYQSPVADVETMVVLKPFCRVGVQGQHRESRYESNMPNPHANDLD